VLNNIFARRYCSELWSCYFIFNVFLPKEGDGGEGSRRARINKRDYPDRRKHLGIDGKSKGAGTCA
jgi:hypothetical protein